MEDKWRNKIIEGDTYSVLKGMPDEYMDMVITSPPYWALRSYLPKDHPDKDKEVGLEGHPTKYIESLVKIFREMRRVLKKTGSFYLNLGDTYFGGCGGPQSWERESDDLEWSDESKKNPHRRDIAEEDSNWLRPKQLLGMPWRVAIALQEDGWILRNAIIWHKPNPMPSSVTDRLNTTYEYVFHFAKAKKYWYDLDAIRVKHKTSPKSMDRLDAYMSNGKYKTGYEGKGEMAMRKAPNPGQEGSFHPLGKNPGDTLEYDSKYNETKDETNPKALYKYRNLKRMMGLPEGHPEGKNPGDVVDTTKTERGLAKDWKGGGIHRKIGQKYQDMLDNDPNYKGKNPGDVVDSKYIDQEGITKKKNDRLYQGQGGFYHVDGKNPGDIITSESKYDEHPDGHTFRAGLHREATLREKRIHQVIQPKIAEYIRKYLTPGRKDELNEFFGEHKWSHWIRTDESGASLPGPEDWWELKRILDFDDTYDKVMTETTIYLDDGMMWKNKAKNPGDYWSIPTKPFSAAHFATFPESLVTRPIKSSCPKEVCKKCGKPRERIVERTTELDEAPMEPRDDKSSQFVKMTEEVGHWGERRDITEFRHLRYSAKTVGWSDCGCGEGFQPGIVLDPFCGSGTACVVAKKLGRDYVGIDLNPEYCEMARQRLEFAGSENMMSFKQYRKTIQEHKSLTEYFNESN